MDARRRLGLGLAALVLLLGLSAACRQGSQPASRELAPAPAPQARAETPPEAPHDAAAAPRVQPAPAEPAPEAAAPEAAVVPLEKLLTWSEERPAPKGVDLSGSGPDAAGAAGAADPGLRDRVYLERRTDEAAPGDRERKLETTDVGVRVPVASSVEVRGGVRVESRQDGESEASKTDPTPTVGVGVRF